MLERPDGPEVGMGLHFLPQRYRYMAIIIIVGCTLLLNRSYGPVFSASQRNIVHQPISSKLVLSRRQALH